MKHYILPKVFSVNNLSTNVSHLLVEHGPGQLSTYTLHKIHIYHLTPHYRQNVNSHKTNKINIGRFSIHKYKMHN